MARQLQRRNDVAEDNDIEESSSIMNDLQEAFRPMDETAGVQAIKSIFSEESLLMKTELQPYEIHYYAKNYVLAKVMKIPELELFCDTELKLKVSNMRKGRREAVEISRQQIEQPRQKGFFGNLFG